MLFSTSLQIVLNSRSRCLRFAASIALLLLRRLLTNVHIVQAAYKRLALLWHPDRHKDEESRERATAQFAKLTQIHDVLTGYINLYPART